MNNVSYREYIITFDADPVHGIYIAYCRSPRTGQGTSVQAGSYSKALSKIREWIDSQSNVHGSPDGWSSDG